MKADINCTTIAIGPNLLVKVDVANNKKGPRGQSDGDNSSSEVLSSGKTLVWARLTKAKHCRTSGPFSLGFS